MTETTRLQKKIVDAMVRRVIDDAVGTSEPALRRYAGFPPDSRFWLGWLAPESRFAPGASPTSATERFTPAAQGFSFRVAALPVELEISVSFALWIPLHPMLDEQKAGAGLDSADEDDQGGGDGHPAGGADPSVPMARVRMKVPVDPVDFAVRVDGVGDRTFGTEEIATAIRTALGIFPPGTVPFRPYRPRGARPRMSDLRDDASWSAFERENLDGPVLPAWVAGVDVEVRGAGREDAPYEVLVTVVNRTPDREHQFMDRDRTRRFPNWACDPNLYEVQLACTTGAALIPYELEQIPDSFRYDRRVPALGHNAAVVSEGVVLRTAFAAIAETDRVYPRTEAEDGHPIDTTFATLKADPLPALTRLLEEARRWKDHNWGTAALNAMAHAGSWRPETRAAAEKDAEAAGEELEWIESGLKLLRANDDLLETFQLMNETMERVARDRYTAWRPFQLAYILGCLPGVVDSAAAPTVDILWFRTGGGKTEAYLGLNILFLFFTRLRGRTAGAQTWARFPLRLLSLQQTQRIADSVILAEVIRRNHPRLRNGDPFGVGYYVGQANTPNRVYLPGTQFYNGWDPFDPDNAEACRVLEVCPACRTPDPVVRFDRDSYTMEHVCENDACPLHGGRLPVYVIDDDIYRWAPSVIVGTVDKLAQLGQQANFRVLLGRARSRCARHGYSVADRCAVFGCNERVLPVPQGFGGLVFEIQDELHLLNESLGALDGNYETLFQTIAEASGVPAVRIIGATATIEGYREQTAHLYRREPRRFPVSGPTKAESFWAYERHGDPLRAYVAMLPRGTTMLNAAFFVTWSHWRFVEEALRDPITFCADMLGVHDGRAGEVEAFLRDLYEVMVTYALRKQELERYAKDIAEDAEICPSGGNYDTITGDVEFWDVREVLNRLEMPPGTPGDRIRVLGATSAISHGVDVDRLNVMTVLGMPKQTSEFIQATARVGRRYPAVVFTLVNPMRERDVSHFRYFAKYAEYLDRLVEPVPVTRESLPVLKRVLPGGLMALLLQVDEPAWLYPDGRPPREKRRRLWWVKEVARAIDEGFISVPGMARRLLRAFAIDETDPRFAEHRRAVEEFASRNLTHFQLQRGSGSPTNAEVDPPVPASLRDVETAIEIFGDR